MSSLLKRVDEELKAALKAKDALRVSALRMLKNAIANQAIQKRKEALEDREIQEVIARLIKQHEESVEAFTKGNRPDLVEKESTEAEVLKGYLPPRMEEAELKALIRSTIQELGVSSDLSAMGAVMEAVMPKVGAQADGKTVSALVRELLQG